MAELTVGWLCQSRRWSKDYERLCEASQAAIYAVMGRPILRRLAPTRGSSPRNLCRVIGAPQRTIRFGTRVLGCCRGRRSALGLPGALDGCLVQ